ncbi:hypothetical protein [Streptomyces vinaceus]|uniref:hypothetical protein n=1 Tax=Streptomyces vinaceus TaxID=1960 RepID=UPI00368848FD
MTYNHEFSRAAEAEELLQSHPPCGGHVPLRAGIELLDRIRLCKGTPVTCPTGSDEVAAGMAHDCDGILGLLDGDLHWLACTGFAGVTPCVVAAGMGPAPRTVALGTAPDWRPDEADIIRTIREFDGRTPIGFVRAVYRGDLA